MTLATCFFDSKTFSPANRLRKFDLPWPTVPKTHTVGLIGSPTLLTILLADGEEAGSLGADARVVACLKVDYGKLDFLRLSSI